MAKWIGDIIELKTTVLPDIYGNGDGREALLVLLDKGRSHKYKITYKRAEGLNLTGQIVYHGKTYYRDKVEFYGYSKRPVNRDYKPIDELVQEYINNEENR